MNKFSEEWNITIRQFPVLQIRNDMCHLLACYVSLGYANFMLLCPELCTGFDGPITRVVIEHARYIY